MAIKPFRQAVFEQFARIGSALSSERRLEIIDLLLQAPRHVDALAAETGLSVANASQHLQALRNAGLVDSERHGNRVVYRLSDPSVIRLWRALQAVGQARLADVDRIVREFDVHGAGSERVARDMVLDQIKSGEFLVLDVRPEQEYRSGHLPGAVSVPVAALPDRLPSLPRDRRIVAYCRGTYCLSADEAVALLKENGFDAVRLDGGWLEWADEARPSSPAVP
jgi:rhodanese-related sulfurtransferase/DNA-binding HxlR family transcriptional regulator